MRDVGAVPCSTGAMSPPEHPMRLVPVRHQDRAAAVAVHDDPSWAPFTFLYGYDPDRGWAEYVSWLADVRRGVGLGPDEVPATFLLAWVDGESVGRASIRHELNDYLEAYGGHVGYGVVPSLRRRGHATEILRQSLVIARAVGVMEVLVTCDEDNVGSIRTIQRCGGVLDSIVEQPDGGPKKRRHWIR